MSKTAATSNITYLPSELLRFFALFFLRLQWTIWGTEKWHNYGRTITWDCPWHAWRAKYHRWAAGLPFREQAEEQRPGETVVGKPGRAERVFGFCPLPGKGDEPFAESRVAQRRSLSWMCLTGPRPAGDVCRGVSVATNHRTTHFRFYRGASRC